MRTNELIEKFVDTINRRPREPMLEDEVPVRLRVKKLESDWYDWRIIRSNEITWIDEIEAKLPARFPDTYSALVRNYEFPALEFCGLMLLSNTREGTHLELRANIFTDPHMSPFLLRHRFIQFARPAPGDYDPICFDARKPAHRNEFPIVQLDHESILCDDLLKVTENIAESFYRLINDFVSAT